MHPILWSLRPYHLGRAVLSSRRSRWVRPPSESETHISWPDEGRSMEVMRASGAWKISREIEVVKESARMVESYALVYT